MRKHKIYYITLIKMKTFIFITQIYLKITKFLISFFYLINPSLNYPLCYYHSTHLIVMWILHLTLLCLLLPFFSYHNLRKLRLKSQSSSSELKAQKIHLRYLLRFRLHLLLCIFLLWLLRTVRLTLKKIN